MACSALACSATEGSALARSAKACQNWPLFSLPSSSQTSLRAGGMVQHAFGKSSDSGAATAAIVRVSEQAVHPFD